MLDLFHSKTAQSLGSWLGILTTVFALLGRLTPQWFGKLTWPQSILLGIGAALVTSLLVAVNLALFRYYRPMIAVPSNANVSSETTDDDAVKRISRLEHNHANLRDKFMAADKLLQSLVARTDELVGTNRATIIDYQAVLNRLLNIDEKLQAGDAQLSTLFERQADHTEWVEARMAALHGSLAAIFHRERMQQHEKALNLDAVELRAPTEQGIRYDADAWSLWEQKEQQWRATLARWCELAELYRPGIRAEIVEVSADTLRDLQWSVQDTQFPNSGAIHAYKTFCVIWRNWRDWKETANRAVQRVAFEQGTVSAPNALAGYNPKQD